MKVWDMRNYKCLQTIQDKESYRPIDQITALIYDPVRAQLLSASTTMRPWPMLKVANPNPNPHPNPNPSRALTLTLLNIALTLLAVAVTLTLTPHPHQEQAEDGFTSIAEYFGRGMFGAPPP